MSVNKYDLIIDTHKVSNEKDNRPQEGAKPLTELDFKLLIEVRDNAFVLYVSSADKLASLVSTDYLKKQFEKRDWKEEYKDIFEEVNNSFKDYDMKIAGQSQMIRNITILLEKWDKENTSNTPKTPISPTKIDELPKI